MPQSPLFGLFQGQRLFFPIHHQEADMPHTYRLTECLQVVQRYSRLFWGSSWSPLYNEGEITGLICLSKPGALAQGFSRYTCPLP